MAPLTLAALGVVFGDIGTSPLYALQSLRRGPRPGTPRTPTSSGCSRSSSGLTLVVSVRYVIFIMRADNEGEGGILALVALVRGASSARLAESRADHHRPLRRGAPLRQRMITPAISVLSAIGGSRSSAGHASFVPLTVAILVGFLIQRWDRRLGRVFGPVMVTWFLLSANRSAIVDQPEILGAHSPTYDQFFVYHPDRSSRSGRSS